jgi:putative flippase GtrA
MKSEKKKETARVIKFILFSASAGIIETVAMVLCEEIIKIPGHWVCYTIALVLSVLWNFTFNRKFTFQSAENVPKAMLLVFLFYVPFAPFTIWNEHFLADIHGWNEYAVLAINMALNLSLEYLWDNFVVYRNSKDTNNIAKKKQEKEQNTHE